MSAATGILFLDILVRPFLKLAVKFPLVGLSILFMFYGLIGYIAIRSAYLADNHS